LTQKIAGNHLELIKPLADQVPPNGTDLDSLWVQVFQCTLQMVMAANKSNKHHYIAISAKTNYCAAEIVRAIEQMERTIQSQSSGGEAFCDTMVKTKIKELCKCISSDSAQQLMVSTRMAIGVWYLYLP
jgi:hypothetical protein